MAWTVTGWSRLSSTSSVRSRRKQVLGVAIMKWGGGYWNINFSRLLEIFAYVWPPPKTKWSLKVCGVEGCGEGGVHICILSDLTQCERHTAPSGDPPLMKPSSPLLLNLCYQTSSQRVHNRISFLYFEEWLHFCGWFHPHPDPHPDPHHIQILTSDTIASSVNERSKSQSC